MQVRAVPEAAAFTQENSLRTFEFQALEEEMFWKVAKKLWKLGDKHNSLRI